MSSMQPPPSNNRRSSTSSARRVLHGVGRPLRRVGRGLFSSRRRSDESSHGNNASASHPHGHGYGGILEQDGNSSVEAGRDGTRSALLQGSGAVSARSNANAISGSANRNDEDSIVHGLETILLRLLVALGAFLLGAYHPQWVAIAWKCTEYVAVAWVTCVVIIVASHVQKYASEQHDMQEEEAVPLLSDEQVNGSRQILPMRDAVVDAPPVTLENEEPPSILEPVPTQHHPELEHLYLLDATNGQRIIPNNPEQPYMISNDLFEGDFLVMLRTPDADNIPEASVGTPQNTIVSDYFRPKQRRFEFQYQLKLKKVPQGRIFFSCQVEEPVKLGMVQKAFVGASLSFVKKMNNGFHYAMPTGPKTADGKYEVPHVSFTVEGSMDRLVVTKPGETPPKLGGVIDEDPESLKRRKKVNYKIDWNTEDTYTFVIWSAYVDFLSWKVLNLPGIRPFYLSTVIGMQHINLTLYVMPPPSGDKSDKQHYQCDMETVVDIEISNTRETMLGPCAQEWVAKTEERKPIKEGRRLSDVPEEICGEAPNGIIQKSDSIDDEDEEFVEDDEDWATVAELGDGIYLRSGDSMVLKESVGDGDMGLDDGFGYVTIAGGFAVLQNQASSTIVIEKARRSRARSKLIKSGDTVMIKLITKGRHGEHTDTKYLSVHRGWWLKWVSIAPTKNGYFTIYTHETEFDLKDGKPQLSSETQTSYLTLNGSFWLRHKRWSKYQVGVSVEESAKFGGRILGLCRHDMLSVGDEAPVPDDEEDAAARLDIQDADVDGKGKKNWMRPLHLVSQEVVGSLTAPRPCVAIKPQSPSWASTSGSLDPPSMPDSFIENIDVPAWVEMMHRTDRRPALVYVVRVMVERTSGTDDDEGQADSSIRCYLRTGRNVAEIIRAFRSHDVAKATRATSVGSSATLKKERQRSRSLDRAVRPGSLRRSSSSEQDKNLLRQSVSLDFNEVDEVVGATDDLGEKEHHSSDSDEAHAMLEQDAASDASFVDPDENQDEHSEPNGTDDQLGSGSETSESEEMSADEYFSADPDSTADHNSQMLPLDSPPLSKKGGRKFMDKIAKSMKTGTSMTGKHVVKHGRKVGMRTVSTGKAIISPISRGGPRPKKPPIREPKSKVKSKERRASRRRKVRDHHVAVKKAVKSIERRRNQKWLSQPPRVLAGQLCAPDQSCRTASHVLSRMAMLPSASAGKFNRILSRQLTSPSDLDRWFLQGGAIELGVVPPKNGLVHESLAARCLWESHFREEWCGIYQTGLLCYAPLTKKPSLELSLADVKSIRRIDPAVGGSPLPGFPLLAIETAWRFHYLAFSDEDARESFRSKVSEAIFLYSNVEDKESSKDGKLREKDLWKARFWQGFQNSVESGLSGGKGKWSPISSKMHRTTLNSRRMVFDIDPLPSTGESDVCEMKTISKFVEELLSKSLTFSLDCLEQDPDSFVQFLDSTSQLRSLPLGSIDLSTDEAFCIFVNIYHCLLQHALLLSVNGPPNKRSIGHFMRCSCYEIGGDVFSLAELHSCVIRGKMSRAVSPKAPYVEAHKKSNTYRFYALDFLDPRINFLLNSADMSCPQAVPVLNAENLEQELQMSTTLFVQSQLSLDEIQKTLILLPKVCDVYRNDFGNGEAKTCLLYCIRYLTESDQVKVLNLLRADHAVVKYQPLCDQFHLFLTRRENTAIDNDEAFAIVSSPKNATDPVEP